MIVETIKNVLYENNEEILDAITTLGYLIQRSTEFNVKESKGESE